jgi:hypothetical protein
MITQERFFLAHATVRLVTAHVTCRAPHMAYTRNEPHARAPNLHAPVVAKVKFDTIYNALKSKRLRSTL